MLQTVAHTGTVLNFFERNIIICHSEQDSMAACTSIAIPASGIRKRQRTVAFGLTIRVEIGSAERFR